tara:strand:+ start:234 stop:674 length:441 start_codon:yes stop_codon:yes gene_type:complete
MNTLFLLCLTFGIVNADMPLPDELKNHYRLIVKEYNTTGCSSTPFNSPYAVQQCQANGTDLPYCCVTMLRSLKFPADENSFNMCLKTGNDTSYFATCEQYYTPSQVQTGVIFGYVVLGMAIAAVLSVFIYCCRKICCRRRNEYDQF